MTAFDTIVRGGTVVTAVDSVRCDIGIKDGRVAALGHDLGSAARVIDAGGLLVLPGGVEGHCHIEQRSSVGGVMSADDFFTGTRSAVFGGTTTVSPSPRSRRARRCARRSRPTMRSRGRRR